MFHQHRIGIFYSLVLSFAAVQLYFSYLEHKMLRREQLPVSSEYSFHVYGGMLVYILLILFALRRLFQRYQPLKPLRVMPSINPREALAKRFRDLKRQTRYR